MQKTYLQLQIWHWQIKNRKWIYMLLLLIFVTGIPMLGGVFCRGVALAEYELSYGYVIFVERTVLSVLGILPFLLMLYAPYHMEAGDCMVLCVGWNEHKQYMISYSVSSIVISVGILLLTIIYCRGVSLLNIFADWIELLVILWMLYAVSYLIVKIIENVYAALVLIELYSVIAWLMGIGRGSVWNIYSIVDLEGTVWLIRLIMYLSLGAVLEQTANRILKS